MTWKTLRLFVNTLTDDNKYSLLRRNNLVQPIQMRLCQKQKLCLNFWVRFPNLHEILNIFKKR